MIQPVLLIDFGSTYTKVAAVDVKEERVLGTARAFTTVQTDIAEGLRKAMDILDSDIGKLDYEKKLACSSAAGGLKMITVGLVPDLTAEAAKRAALSAGAKISGFYAYELSETEIEEIKSKKPDIILLTGGTDGGNKNVILHNARMISKIDGDFPVVIAGNKSAAKEAETILASCDKDVCICENVMPEFNVLNIMPAREAIRNIFLKRIIRAKGLTHAQDMIEGILMPTPSAVLKAVYLLSVGAGEEKGIGDLMAVDVGGATTDVYSIAAGEPTKPGVILKGLPEPFAKRTVEGDLGVRYSSGPLAETLGIDKIAGQTGLSNDEIVFLLEEVRKNPDILPGDSEKIKLLDSGLASLAVKSATDRHAGTIETAYTPFGATFVQTGKDLSNVDKIIGTGGPVINNENAEKIMKQALSDSNNPTVLKPQKAEILIDKKYILAAMGLLSEKYAEISVRIMKKELEMT